MTPRQFNETIGGRLRAARHALKLSMEALSKRTGVKPYAICCIERGKSERPSAFVLYKLATALGIRMDELMREL